MRCNRKAHDKKLNLPMHFVDPEAPYHVNNSSFFACILRRMSQVCIFKLCFMLNILVLSINNKVWKVFHQDFWLNFVGIFSPYMLLALPMSSCSDLIISELSKCVAPILQLSLSNLSHTNSCQTTFILWCTKRNSPFYVAHKLNVLCLETVQTVRYT